MFDMIIVTVPSIENYNILLGITKIISIEMKNVIRHSILFY